MSAFRMHLLLGQGYFSKPGGEWRFHAILWPKKPVGVEATYQPLIRRNDNLGCGRVWMNC